MRITNRSDIPSKERTPFPSIFFSLLSPSDVTTLRRQARAARGERRFSPGLVRGVSARCGYGCPQVILCGALRRREPFPTSFWLVCPHLLRAAGRLEAANGVAALERFLSDLPGGAARWLRYHKSHARLRLALVGEGERAFLRLYRRGLYRAIFRGGVGGIAYSAGESAEPVKPAKIFAKCLHLQIASYLGMGRHPAAEWLEKNIGSWECGTGVCVGPDLA